MAGNLCKPIRGVNLNRKSASQYGYVPSVSRSAGKGPGEHYVFPDLFGDGKDNANVAIAAGVGAQGLSVTAGQALPAGAGTSIKSAFYDLSGWQRWTVFVTLNVGVTAPGMNLTLRSFADPAFNNQINASQIALTVGLVTHTLDSQFITVSNGFIFSPYMRFDLVNLDAAQAYTVQSCLFCYSYLMR